MSEKKDLYKLLDQAISKQKYSIYKKGDLVEGVIEKKTPKYLIVKIDNTYDAVIASSEMIKDGKEYNVGDVIKVFVVKSEDEYGNMIVSQTRTTVGQRWDMLEEAYKTDTAVLVTVTEANNGGVIVNADGVAGFIPTSQLDPNKVYKLDVENTNKDDIQKELSRKLAELIGTKLNAKVVEIDKTKNRVIFSEKLALNDQSAELRNETIRNAKIGQEMDGVVTAVTPYGIFVNADGLDGLVHVSEISWDKVDNVSEFAMVGATIKVKLIDISEDGKRVAYSIKQLSDDPWNEVSADFNVGSKVKGTITEIEDYGVILKIAEGVTGLIHRSELSDKNIGDPKDFFKVGQEVEAVIMTISPSERKMGLSIKRLLGSDGKKSSIKKSKKIKKKTPGSIDIAGALEKAGISSDETLADEDTTESKEE